ncbi:hypothetical protein AAMO2058_000002100 [Amorphochlora amoebiformis]
MAANIPWPAVCYQGMLPLYIGTAFIRPLDRIYETMEVLPKEVATPWGAGWLILSADGILSFSSGFGIKILYGFVQKLSHSVAIGMSTMIYTPRPITRGDSRENIENKLFWDTARILKISFFGIPYPLETSVSVYLLSSARYSLGQGAEYSGVLNAMGQIYGKYGYSGLYTGISSRLLQLNLQFALGYMGLDVADNGTDIGDEKASESYSMTDLGIALMAAAATYPLYGAVEKVRRGWINPEAVEYRSTSEAMASTMDNEGILGLFGGVTFFVFRRAILFGVCKYVSWNFTKAWNDYTQSASREVGGRRPLA